MKPGPLTDAERRLIESHTILGEQMVGEAALLRGEGARVVRSHHERWDGKGYPDGLSRGRHSDRSAHLHDRRRARRDDQRPAIPACGQLGRGRERDRQASGHPVRPRARRRLPRARGGTAADLRRVQHQLGAISRCRPCGAAAPRASPGLERVRLRSPSRPGDDREVVELHRAARFANPERRHLAERGLATGGASSLSRSVLARRCQPRRTGSAGQW